ncbi:CLUMA_CG014631, isoform A [Clunio marinus]|uniref:CLUMA_CG014631, isoform A n=1 Tax=Clunio marinus TaxID=568069 RepID=A0A1J1IMY0_9DIPT|nr:CLUMA_CG014631, isoform A [Clunio marinus]
MKILLLDLCRMAGLFKEHHYPAATFTTSVLLTSMRWTQTSNSFFRTQTSRALKLSKQFNITGKPSCVNK